MQTINHGIITGALFLLVGVIYERTHDRTIAKMGGLASRVLHLRGAPRLLRDGERGPAGPRRLRGRVPSSSSARSPTTRGPRRPRCWRSSSARSTCSGCTSAWSSVRSATS
ncbi:MAG: hypothetical protein U0869_02815 [Chloroflexota bacterium]